MKNPTAVVALALLWTWTAARWLVSRAVPAALIGAALGEVIAAPIAAQTGPSPQYPLTWSLNEKIGPDSATEPNGGTPPDYVNRPPAFNETVDPTPWITGDGVNYRDLSNVTGGTFDESKMRTICVNNGIGVYDSIRGKGQKPYGHGHSFFGNRHITENSDFTSLRQNPDSSCAGGMENGSAYWTQWLYKNDVFRAGKPLVHKFDSVSLYYNSTECYSDHSTGTYGKDFTSPNRCQPIPRGFQTVFGFNMDNNYGWFYTAVANYAAAHPELGTMTVESPNGVWRCANNNGHTSTSPVAGENQPYLSDGAGNVAVNCPAGTQLVNSFVSSSCWDGRLKADGGFQNLVPRVLMQDGQYHCPNHFYRLPSIFVNFNYSHLGPSDYVNWRCSSDAAAAAVLGRAAKPCESTHNDYIFGWDERQSNKWQCFILGISVPGMTGCHAAEGDNSTISPTERLIYNEPRPNGPGQVAPNNLIFNGSKLGDWWVPTPAQQGPFNVHAGMAH